MALETPKGVSSRLLTMKFMQRAAASASSSPGTESNSSKKRKLNHSPAQGRLNALIDQASIQAALDDQEAKRQAALEKHSTADSRWVLNTTFDKPKPDRPSNAPLNIVYVGYGDIDSSNESGGEDAPQSGRMSTRKNSRRNRRRAAMKSQIQNQNQNQTSGSGKPSNAEDDSSEDASSDDDDDSSPKRRSRHSDAGQDSRERSSQSRSRSRSKLSQESKKAKDFREKRKKKDIRLNQITSISNSLGPSSSPSSPTCYNCKQPGHKASNCPDGGSQSSSRKS